MLNLIFIALVLGVIIYSALLIDLVTTIKLYHQEEWHSLYKPSPWFVNMNMSLLVHILTGKFLATATDELIPKYKTLRFILFINIIFFFLYVILVIK